MSSDLVASPDPDDPAYVVISRSGRLVAKTLPEARFNSNPRRMKNGIVGFLNRVYPLGNWTLTWRKA
ncbi:MAG: hypothetical protein KGI98_11960 [Euryarchaeota archaeon]|nr:hypothetical protein [Euryarchaeota archaeon]MDE1881581.1 hypothetical protein [Euryarchaeota archaeon]